MDKKLKSKAKQIKDIDFSKELIINKLYGDKKLVELHFEKLSKIYSTEPREKIADRVKNIIIRDNIFNAAMNIIVESFQIDYDLDEVQKIKQEYKSHLGQDRSDEFCESVAKKIIAKTLIFQILAKNWNIEVTDKEVNDALINYYKISNESIREYEQDKNKFENIRSIILEEKVSNKIVNSFKYRLQLENNNNNNNNDKK